MAGGIGSQALRLEVITNGFSINWIGLNATQRGTNIALYKVATASSLENAGYPATNAVDGNLTTRWSSANSVIRNGFMWIWGQPTTSRK